MANEESLIKGHLQRYRQCSRNQQVLVWYYRASNSREPWLPWVWKSLPGQGWVRSTGRGPLKLGKGIKPTTVTQKGGSEGNKFPSLTLPFIQLPSARSHWTNSLGPHRTCKLIDTAHINQLPQPMEGWRWVNNESGGTSENYPVKYHFHSLLTTRETEVWHHEGTCPRAYSLQARAGLVIHVFWWLFTTILRWWVFPSTPNKGENDQ